MLATNENSEALSYNKQILSLEKGGDQNRAVVKGQWSKYDFKRMLMLLYDS